MQAHRRRKPKDDEEWNEDDEDFSDDSEFTDSEADIGSESEVDEETGSKNKDQNPGTESSAPRKQRKKLSIEEKKARQKERYQQKMQKLYPNGRVKRQKLSYEEKRARQKQRYLERVKHLQPETGPARFFNLVFDSTIARNLAEWINANRKLIPEKKDKHPLARKWRDLGELEFRRFIGILFFIGAVKKPNLKEYWRVEPSIDSAEEPSIRRLMHRDRFEQILSSFPESSEDWVKPILGEQVATEMKPKPKGKHNDAVAVISDLCSGILENSKKNYNFSKVVSLDSSKVSIGPASAAAQVGGKQSSQLRPFLLYESKTGFVLNCVMSRSETRENRQTMTETALRLLIPHKYDEFSVYIASSYTSNQLLAELLKHNIKACGKISFKDIDAPESFHHEINDLPSVVSRQYIIDSQTVGLWKDGKKVFCLVSTLHNPFNTNNTTANSNQLSIEEISPYVVLKDRLTLDQMAKDYSTSVGLGNRFDERMLKFANTAAFRSRKLLLGVLYYYLEIAMVNSYLMYFESEKGNKDCLSQREYRIHVIENLSRNARRLMLIRNVKKSKESVQLEKIQLLSRSGRCFLVPNGSPAICKICCARPAVKKIKSSYKCHPCQLSVCAVGCYDSHRMFVEAQKFVFK